MIRSPLKSKRDKPRRKAPDRVAHNRTKPKAGAYPTAEQSRFITVVRAMPCLVCGAASTVHHVTGYADRIGRFARSHWLIVPLCARHHQKVFDPKDADPISVEGLTHRGFFEKYGIDLLAVARRLADEFRKEGQ